MKAVGALALSLTAAGAAGAQAQATTTPSPSTAATKITTRQLPAAMATSTDSIGSVAAVRQLPNGNVLVNDQARRRVIMLDKNMKLVGVVADSTSSTANAYGVRPGGCDHLLGAAGAWRKPANR